jgi:hypothetical protein
MPNARVSHLARTVSARRWFIGSAREPLQYSCIQQTRPVDDTQDDHSGADDFEEGSVVAEQQVAVGRAEEVIFRHEGAALGIAFQGSDLLFQAQDKGGGRIGVVLGNVIPDGGYIRLGCGGDINPVFFWHV